VILRHKSHGRGIDEEITRSCANSGIMLSAPARPGTDRLMQGFREGQLLPRLAYWILISIA
jgi:hypothetical protein